MTPEEAERVTRLRAILPHIHRNSWEQTACADGALLCIDLEWDENWPHRLECIGIGNEKWVSQFWWQELDLVAQDKLRQDLLDVCRAVPVVIHNAVGDIKKLREAGFAFLGPQNFAELNDSMVLHHHLESENQHDLEYLGLEHGSLPAYKDLRTVAGAEDVYNACDLVQTCVVWNRYLKPAMNRDPRTEFIYRTMSMPFIWQIIEGEEAGIRVNPHTPVPLYQKYDIKRVQATTLAQAYAGWPLNLGSPDQMAHVLYNVEGLPIQRKRAGWGEEGAVTVGKDAIATLRRLQGTEWDADIAPTLLDSEVVDDEGVVQVHKGAMSNIEDGGHPILEARYLFMGAQQAISHYIMPCLDIIEGPRYVGTGVKEPDLFIPRARIWPECRQHVQSSGRHSYVQPALSQFKDDMLTLITPDVGTCWVGHDWKQIEVRLLAYLASDQVYIDIFARGGDIHEENVRAIFGAKGSPELEALRRRFIKAFVFRLHYRGKPENAGDIPGTKSLGLVVDRLIEASARYLAVHTALPPYWHAIEVEADRTGGVRTFMGRLRKLTAQYLAARNREACNHPMQGGVTDIYVTTALQVKAAAVAARIPVRLVYGSFDSQFWQVPSEARLDFIGIYQPIVEREFVVNGRTVTFPADFKLKEAA